MPPPSTGRWSFYPIPLKGLVTITFSVKGGGGDYIPFPFEGWWWQSPLPFQGWWWLCPFPLKGGGGYHPSL